MGRMVASIVTLVMLVTLLLGAGAPAEAISITPRNGTPDQGQQRGSVDARHERGRAAEDRDRQQARAAGDRDREQTRAADDERRKPARGAHDRHQEQGRDAGDADRQRERQRGADDDRDRKPARGADDKGRDQDRDADDEDRQRTRDEPEEPADRGRGRADGRGTEGAAGNPDRTPRAAAPEPTPSRSREDDGASAGSRTDAVAGAAPDAGTGDEDDAASVPDPRTLRLLGLGGYLTGGPAWWGGQPDAGPMFGVPGLPRTIGGLPVLLALLGAFLALQRGIGNGLGHVPMDPTSPEPDTHAHR